MTLRELTAQVTGKKKPKALHYSTLLASGVPVVASSEHDNGSVTAFANGYIVYTEDDYVTVFHVSEITGKNKRVPDDERDNLGQDKKRIADILEDLDWRIGAVMKGNSRITSNREAYQAEMVQYHYSEIPEEVTHIGAYYDLSTDADELSASVRKVVEEIKKEIRPTQWVVYVGIAVNKMTQDEMASHLKISQQAVGKRYKNALRNVSLAKRKVQKKIDENNF